jgi:hypothetical protein
MTATTIMLHKKRIFRGHPKRVPLWAKDDLQEFLHLGGTSQMENSAIGDTLCVPKDANIAIIHFQNVNRISLGKGGTWEGVCGNWKHMEVDIGVVCKTKLDMTTQGTSAGLKEGATRHFGIRAFRMMIGASTPIKHERHYKLGGVLGMVVGPIAGRIMNMHKDEAGRWISITLRRRQANPVTIICTYQMVDMDPQTVGPETYATQLLAYYQGEGHPHPEPLRKHHANDLVRYVQECKNHGSHLVTVCSR